MNPLDQLDRQLDNPTEGMLITRARLIDNKIVFGGVWRLLGKFHVEGTWRYGKESNHCLESKEELVNKTSGIVDPNETVKYCFSANPDHIKQAREAMKQSKIKREQKRKQSVDKLKKIQTELNTLLQSYGAELYPVQLSGDDQGVVIAIELTLDGIDTAIIL